MKRVWWKIELALMPLSQVFAIAANVVDTVIERDTPWRRRKAELRLSHLHNRSVYLKNRLSDVERKAA